ncbi:ATP-binding cassette, subfamily B (MDR/TAP), member 1 [Alternaria panax]|uniref:ATP-binding cassette, subfamily B (MDR/TAP), member 1 n=1 Tax=Alternaria panax TaxID=48097 RepID=A0AAD4IBY3_9PLEO|nr:ATP-binding cassette, subfamily B (MDR/TAP), member 1 [Alternaria panax]
MLPLQDEITDRCLEKIWSWNSTVPEAIEKCVHDLFAEQAKARPDAPAVCAWDGELTYGELDALSSKLAGHLIQLGVQREDVVPLCFEKSMWTVVAMLAVLKVGGAFLLLDPSLPAERLAAMCRKVGSVRALASEACLPAVTDLVREVVLVDKRSLLQMPKYNGPLSSALPTDAAYVVFTSGSTGEPKGCKIEHRSSCTAIIQHGPSLQISTSTRVLQFSSYSFTGCLIETLLSLAHGGCLCVPSEEQRRVGLASAMTRMAVNWALLTPTVVDTIGGPESVPSLTTLCVGGEAMHATQIQQWEGCVHLRQAYGSSEVSGLVSSARLTRASTTRDVGKASTAVYWIVDADDHDRLVPLGATGELLVEGAVLGRGYTDEAKKTAATFIGAPAWRRCFSESQSRLYKTGDLARYKEDGSIELLGRKDTQVKLRGQRIELGEIEHQARLSGAAGVRGLAVELIRPGDKGDMLACFIAAESNGAQEETDDAARIQAMVQKIRERLEQFLPQYMVPTLFVPLAQLPKTTSQKLDRKRLREIGASFTAQQLTEMRTSSQGPKRQPSTEVERTMQQLWARVLSIEPGSIGLDDSFFSLGGDSIAAMKLVGEAHRTGLQLSVADIFRHPRLVDVTSTATCDVNSSSTAIVPVDDAGPVEQSYAQGRLWFLEQLHPGLNWYVMPFAVHIRGPLQLEALNAALLAVESRHETLRTTFATKGGASVQIVQPFCAKQLNVIELPPGDEYSRLDAIQRDQTTPFDLHSEPGWRVAVYRLGNNNHVLSIVMHHIVSDGWSVDVLMRELTTFYSASLRGQDPLSQVQPLPIQYRDFSLWQRQEAQIDEHQRQLSYWLAQLQTSRPAELLCDKPRPATLSGKADTRNLEIGDVLYAQLQQFCKERGVTLFVVLLAVFRATHFRLTGQDDATIGTANASRNRWELKDMIGFFVNMQCLRTTIVDESFEELVQQVQAVAVASFANQDVPFESIVSKLKKDRDLSRHPLVQLVFVVHSQRDLGELILEGVETEGLDGPATSRFDLEFHFYQKLDGLQGNVIFSTDLYTPETIENMLSVFNNVLERCLREPTVAIASLPLLTDTDYAKLDRMGLVQIQETGYPRESSIVDLFRQQASVYRSMIAVKDSTQEMTYSQLDEASDVIARWLRRRSLAPETLVGVFANRCCQTIVAFLGIMKAGLAYLPFDVKIPGKRMEAVLRSLPGQKIVLLGNNVQPSDMKLSNVEFVHITKTLDEGADDESGSQEPATTFFGPSATSLAYVMYTSGSTGKPKGVMVEHRGIVRLVRDNNIVQHLPVSRVMAHVSNLAFDASTWEIYVSLLNGGTLVCIEAMTALDPVAMLQTVSNCEITMAMLTPALFRQYIADSPAVVAALSMLCVGGEALHPRDFFAAEKIMKGKLINCYGPTENTGISTSFVLTKDEKYTNGVPIGRALSNSGAYVMDPHQQLVPLGVIGELVVTGDGVARGYTDSRRNIGRFVSVEIAGEKVKAYQTGDYVRHRPSDGQLEFFGRMDGQIKIRGQRIELGEIEHVLRSHRSVTDAVIVLQHHDGGEAQLAGFVTIYEDDVISEQPGYRSGDEAQHVNTWEKQFDDEIYSSIGNCRPKAIGRDFIGWTSMYDGSEIDKTEMNEWLDDTIATILNGRGPGHVLEIGSGTGMILFNLGEGLKSYIGLDPSENAVNFVEKTAKSMPTLAGRVRMHKATAADVGQLERPIAANLVVMNSVVQYFPSQEYLFKVVQELVALDGVQTLFFGDIRSYALYQEFLSARALQIAGNKATKAELRRMMADMECVERELLVDPAFFTALPSLLPGLVEHVEILPKKMKATNELSCYRYTAVVHTGTKDRREQGREIRQVEDKEWIDFTECGLNRQSLQQQLKANSISSTIAVSNIPYKKSILTRCLVESLDDVAADALGHQGWLSSVHEKAQRCPALSATDLVEVAQEAGCRVEISWCRQHSQHGGLDAIFHRCTTESGENRVLFRFPTDHAERPLRSFSNKPLRQQVLHKTQQELCEILEAQLPAYMVPRTITVLDAMPINQNGKVDRGMLAQRRQEQTIREGTVRQPTSAAERTMRQLWARVLDIEQDSIGLDDSFFSLGGDSITAMKLVAEARKQSVHLTVASIFQHPRLCDLALKLQTSEIESDAILTSLNALAVSPDLVSTLESEVLPKLSIARSHVQDLLPITDFQRLCLAGHSKSPPMWMAYFSFLVPNGYSGQRIRNLIHLIWQHYDALRLLFTPLSDHIWQVSTRGTTPPILERSIGPNENHEKIYKEDSSHPFRSGEQLTQFFIISNSKEVRLTLRVSHAQYDGLSIARLCNDLQNLTNGRIRSNTSQYADFINHTLQIKQDGHAYWKSLLRGSTMTFIEPEQDSSSDTQLNVTRDTKLPIPRDDSTLASIFTAACACALAKVARQSDVVFARVVNGRSSLPENSDVFGNCCNFNPTRIHFDGHPPFDKTVKQLSAQYRESLPYESVGFRDITENCTDWPSGTEFGCFVRFQNQGIGAQ